jgi:hypothetical protein
MHLKILANRARHVLPSLMSPNQSAFVHGGRIGDNIILAQEEVRGYDRQNLSPCTLKIDSMKAFDVHWNFILNVLAAMNFPSQFIN